MPSLCRFLGGMILAISTLTWGIGLSKDEFQFAWKGAAGAFLALVFLIAGQLAQAIDDRSAAETQRRRSPPA